MEGILQTAPNTPMTITRRPENHKPRSQNPYEKPPEATGFLIDEDISLLSFRKLATDGLSVSHVKDVARGAGDRTILRRACKKNLIVVTRNRGDFGMWIFEKGMDPPAGVIEVRHRYPSENTLVRSIREHYHRSEGRFLVISYDEDRQSYTFREGHPFPNYTDSTAPNIRSKVAT